MTLTLFTIISIVLSHYIADFVCQTDWMARNKSKENKPLLVHIGTYSSIMFVILSVMLSVPLSAIFVFVLVNGILHFFTDWVTSRVTSRLYQQGKMGSEKIPNFGFYSIIGLDQLIHYVCLFSTAVWILK